MKLFKKNSKVIKELWYDKELVNNILDSQSSRYPKNKELSRKILSFIETWISSVNQEEHYITFRFNNWYSYESWNANKGHVWLCRDHIITNPEWEKIYYKEESQITREAMKPLLIASYIDNAKKLEYEIPKELQEALTLSHKYEVLTYEIKTMQDKIQRDLDSMESEKQEFKEKYWSDIITILSKYWKSVK